jgi:Ca2+-binding RTX toxin-like protein
VPSRQKPGGTGVFDGDGNPYQEDHVKRTTTLAASVTALAAFLPALLASPIASAQTPKVDGVRAEIKRGTLDVKGGDQANRVALRLKAGDATVVQVDVGDDGFADFSFARGDVDAINVKMGDGNDSVRVDDANGAFTNTIPTTIAGGDGEDSLSGGLGAETFKGGDGDDRVAGGRGADTAYLGRGDDTFRWDPGDGSDVVEGQDDTDAMVFNGAAVGETVTMTAHDGRLTFFRNPAGITMDTNGVERVDFNALGGSDNVTINDLSGTDVTQTNIDLASSVGGNTADGLVDNVIVNATNGDDNIAVNGGGSGVHVTGLATAVSITHADPTDSLSVNTLAGNDSVLTNGVAAVVQMLIDGVAV